ncbi:CRIB domain-containing protein RIC4-like isoform X1 [Tasmannia lanceolata]|uniref:CRIB domain-containing protein RIC4-like isoform X1 n=1 Tax=Tasmannia lanceolata TaxID=3420 RepID=UPI0040642598
MKDRMERLVVLPFTIGCVSQTSVAVSEHNPKKTKQEQNPSSTIFFLWVSKERQSLSGGKMKNSFGFFSLPKSNISAGLHRLIKSFSQLFVYKEEGDGEMGMEIGMPTDVKHVTHIGWDGSTTTTTTLNNWDGLKAPDQLISLPSISLKQFELVMAAQADVPLSIDSAIRLS